MQLSVYFLKPAQTVVKVFVGALDKGDDDHVLRIRQLIGHLLRLLPMRMHLSVVPHRVHREQHFRPDLPEPVQHPFDAEVRRRAAPHRSQGGAREHRHHRFDAVRNVAGHPVVGGDPASFQRRRHDPHSLAQLLVGDSDRFPAFACILTIYKLGFRLETWENYGFLN